eukprot:2467086-Amphidinium_carterae.1
MSKNKLFFRPVKPFQAIGRQYAFVLSISCVWLYCDQHCQGIGNRSWRRHLSDEEHTVYASAELEPHALGHNRFLAALQFDLFFFISEFPETAERAEHFTAILKGV